MTSVVSHESVAGAGGAPAPFSLPPATYQLRFVNAYFDLLLGQYQDLYTELLVVPTIGTVSTPLTHNLLMGAIRVLALPACVAYALFVIYGIGRLHVNTYVNLARYHSLPKFPATPWNNRIFAQQGDVVRSVGSFTRFSLAGCPNHNFNLTVSVPALVVGGRDNINVSAGRSRVNH